MRAHFAHGGGNGGGQDHRLADSLFLPEIRGGVARSPFVLRLRRLALSLGLGSSALWGAFTSHVGRILRRFRRLHAGLLRGRILLRVRLVSAGRVCLERGPLARSLPRPSGPSLLRRSPVGICPSAGRMPPACPLRRRLLHSLEAGSGALHGLRQGR